MKKLAIVTAAVFLAVAEMAWADAERNSGNNVNPLPSDQKQQATSGDTEKVKVILQTNESGDGKSKGNTNENLNPQKSQKSFLQRMMEKAGIYYFFKHDDGKHTMVPGQGQNKAATTNKNTIDKNIPKVGNEVIVNFEEGDPDKPIITGKVYNAESNPPSNDIKINKTTDKVPNGKTTKSKPNPNVRLKDSLKPGNLQKPATFTAAAAGKTAFQKANNFQKPQNPLGSTGMGNGSSQPMGAAGR